MTTAYRNLLIVLTSFVVSAPALATVFDIGPMGYHDGFALLVRVVAVFLATASLAGVLAMSGYLYWLHVIAPAPAPRRELVLQRGAGVVERFLGADSHLV